jgi:transcription-repair coupling factor (superfamily II helicase)
MAHSPPWRGGPCPTIPRPMRQLRDRYRTDARVRSLLSGAREKAVDLVIGACHGGLIPVLIAAWWAEAVESGGVRPGCIISGNPQSLLDDLEELGVKAAILPELDRFADDLSDTRGQDKAGHTKRMGALEAFATGSVLIASPTAAEQLVPDLKEVMGQSLILRPGDNQEMHELVDRLVSTGYHVRGIVEGRGEVAVRGGILDVFPWVGNDPYRIEFFGDQVDSIRRFDAFSQESINKADEAILASAKGGLATKRFWDQLGPEPIVVVGDVPLRGRLKTDHGRREIRFARQLEEGALDGASTGIERLDGDARRGLVELSRMLEESGDDAAVTLFARNDEARQELERIARDAGVTAAVRIGRLSEGFRDVETGLVVAHDFELLHREPVKRRSNRVSGGTPLSSLNDLKRGDHVVHLRHGIGIFRGMATLEKRGFLEDFLLLEFAQETKLYVPVDAIDLVQKFVGASARPPELSTIGGTAWAKKRAKAEKAIEDMSGELLQAAADRVARGGIAIPVGTPDERRFGAEFPYEETEDQLGAVREITADLQKSMAMDRLLCGDVGFGKTEVAMRAAFAVAAAGKQVAVLAPTTLLAEQHYESFSERFAPFPNVRIAGLNRFRTTAERRDILAKLVAHELDILIGTHAILAEDLRFADLGLLIIDEEHRFGVKQKEKLRALRGLPTPAEAAPAEESVPIAASVEAEAIPAPSAKRTSIYAVDSIPTPLTGTLVTGKTAPVPQPVPTTAATSGRAVAPGMAPGVAQVRSAAIHPAVKPPHVLTLSATPIPRTLHFSMLGLRDISVLAEAPAARLAVETRVAPWDDELVRHACQRELDRQGQIFVVHHRVSDLDQVAYKLSKLIPGMKLDTLHAQMDTDRIHRVMEAFRHKALDCLVATSLIENGIDIPNANTLFVSNAHHFGLAELHQIRGRVGRFTNQAYAYFLTPPGRELGQDAVERLDAIQEYAELGAGFKLAMRDLELRGAGNLLGAEQTGHIDAIGYELYAKMLQEAVEKAKRQLGVAGGAAAPAPAKPKTGKEKEADAAAGFLNAKVDAYIPDTYLETPQLKFDLHKQLDGARTLDALSQVARQARDRYGAFPDPVVRLFQVRALRQRAKTLGITRIDVAEKTFRLHLSAGIPKELMGVKVPEIIHIQPDGPVLVLFVRLGLDQDKALNLLCRLLALDLGFLGRGF